MAADEGALIAQEMKEILGNVSLEHIRDLLMEVKELRSEFLGLNKTASSTALLLNFLETKKDDLIKVFGEIPSTIIESIHWFLKSVNQYQNTEAIILDLEEQKNKLKSQKNQFLKGYSKEILENSIDNLNGVKMSLFHFPFEEETKVFFADLCIHIPAFLNQAREILYYVSRNQPFDVFYWDFLKSKIQSYSNTFSLCILDGEICGSKSSLSVNLFNSREIFDKEVS